ncbi:DUF4391 domain-containing protein [Nocardioides renjunii]|uniref:DUF4391 domain-containing protein n=1 Tax=Nocardioides renjunii TaxID=3095075 RepID=UPI002AFE322F|nr:DUF4391 domain-containing protein [Nocardioides sp. S-34]WQQ22395.1 DUF4391 domain-containing protein [Nocardioides sp. S-34]
MDDAGPLFRWPSKGRVGRTIPKERLYAEARITSRVKQRFVEDLQRVTWAYKIGEQALPLKPCDSMTEFQIFEVELKADDVADQVLKTIDGAVPSPVIFELIRNRAGHAEIQVAAARKELGQRGPKLSSYFRSHWGPGDAVRSDLPAALDLGGLYDGVLAALLPLSARPGEDLSEAIGRMTRVAQLEREIGALERRLRNERQLNRKVALRRALKTKQAELEQQR